MSIVETDKLIVLITDLNDLLLSWDVSASDVYQHTKKVCAEDVEITSLAEKDKSKAIETELSDGQAVAKSKKESDELYEKSSELFKLTESLPSLAQHKLVQSQNFLKQSQQNNQKSKEWRSISEKEFRRAKDEYDKALEEYNCQVDIRNAALNRLRNTPESYTVTRKDSNGHSHTETRHNPEWDRAKAAFDREEAELGRRKQILNRAEATLDLAKTQFDLSMQASELSMQMLKNSQSVVERAKDLKEWSDNSYKSASHAVSAAKSALNLDAEAVKQNGFQNEVNEETLRLYEKIKSSLDEAVTAVQKVVGLIDSCNAMDVNYRSSLNGKKMLLHKLGSILPDEIQSLTIK